MTFTMIVAGLVLLLAGGEALVRGSVSLATRLGVSPLMIGLTLVGFGTSAPELFTSLQAGFAGSSGIAVGNIVGSNIANILLILGLAALFMPIATQRTALIRDGALLVGSTLLFAALCYSGKLGTMAGAVLLAGLAAYLLLLWTQERSRPDNTLTETAATAKDAMLPSLLFSVSGIALIMLGARFLVTGAIDLARIWGTPESVVGLTIVAIGTSLPELATSIVAAIRKQPDVAFGNVIGSNIFNVLAIGGTTALVTPLEIPSDMLGFDIPVMIAVSFVLVFVAWTGSRIVRLEGALLLACFGVHQLLLWT